MKIKILIYSYSQRIKNILNEIKVNMAVYFIIDTLAKQTKILGTLMINEIIKICICRSELTKKDHKLFCTVMITTSMCENTYIYTQSRVFETISS